MHIVDSILHTINRHISGSPVSIADPAFLKQGKISQVIIDSILQTGRIPDIPAPAIYNMALLINVGKDNSDLTNTLLIVTRSFIRQQYWRSFSARSAAYRKAVPTPAEFNNFNYFINGSSIKTPLEEALTQIPAASIVKIKTDKEGVKIKTKQ
jgi:hypothetical protein